MSPNIALLSRLFFGAFLLLASATAGAADFYFSPSGNDSTGDGTQTNPWATIIKANSLDLEPGDTLLFEGGGQFSTSVPGAVNAVTDPGFESGNLNSWPLNNFGVTPGNSSVITGNNVYEGVYALRITGSDDGSVAQEVTTQLTEGKRYRFTLRAKFVGTGTEWAGAGLNIKTGGENGTNIASATISVSGETYKKYTTVVSVPAGAGFDFAELWTYKIGGSRDVYFDSIEIEEVAPLIFADEDAGTPSQPVRAISYGTGKAQILAADANGIIIQSGGVEVEDFIISGDFTNNQQDLNGGHGILLLGTQDIANRKEYVRIRDCTVHGFREAGILIDDAYRDIDIRGVEVYDIGEEGIAGHASVGDIQNPIYPIEDVYVGHSHVYDIWGRTADTGSHTGNGVFFSGVDGLMVEWNKIHNTGVNSVTTSGPVALFAWRTRDTYFQYNEVYEAHRTSGEDGGAIDFGELVTDSYIQYNYTHDNDGYGILVDLNYDDGAAGENVTVRYNVSENDARKRPYGAIFINSAFEGLKVYGNTIYMTPPSGHHGKSSGIHMGYHASAPTDVQVYNNIFLINDSEATGDIYAVNMQKTGTGNTFTNNIYHNLSNNGLRFRWGGTTYDSLDAWRAGTGQEMMNGSPVGSDSNPLLAAPGTTGTLSSVYDITSIHAYTPASGSPAIDAALDLLTEFGIDMGTQDFLGTGIPVNGAYDIGAVEFISGSVPDTYASWSASQPWPLGSNTTPSGDSDGDGVVNLLEYALDLDVASNDYDKQPVGGFIDDSTDQWATITFRRNKLQSDLTFTIERSSDLSASGWSDVTIDGINAIETIVDSDVDGDGSTELVEVKIKLPSGDDVLFLRLQIEDDSANMFASSPVNGGGFGQPFREDFEAYAALSTLSGQGGWLLHGGMDPTIETAVDSRRGQVAGITSDGSSTTDIAAYYQTNGSTVTWVEVSQVPGTFSTGSTPAVAADTSFAYFFDTDGYLNVTDGNNWSVLDGVESVDTDTWQRVTAKIDYSSDAVDVWLNGVSVATQLAFLDNMPQFSRVFATHDATQAAYLDDIITQTNPIEALLPYSQGFESLGNGADIDGHQNIWSVVSGSGTVDDSQASTGSTSLKVDGKVSADLRGAGLETTWVDLSVYPSGSASAPSLDAGTLVGIYFDDNGKVWVRNADTWTDSGASVTLGNWHRITACLDYASGTWDLYVNDFSAGVGYLFQATPETDSFRTVTVSGSNDWIDSVLVDVVNPL